MRKKKNDRNSSEKTEKASKKSAKSSTTMSGKNIIGLDITPTTIRMIQISGRGIGQVQVEKYAIEPLPQNVVSGSEIVNFDMLVSHLQQCYSKMKTNCKSVNIALPSSIVTIEDGLAFAPGGDMGLQDFVEAEVSRVGALDEMNYDWQVLDPLSGERDEVVIMVAAKTDSVNQYTDLLDEVNLTASNVDVDIFALFNSFAYVNAVNNNEFFYDRVALFDIGDISMKALIVESGRILYRHETPFGLDQLLQLVQRSYQATEHEALEMIYGKRQRPADYKATVTDYFNVQVAQEIQRALQFFSTTRSDDQPIRHIFVSGSACVPQSGMCEAIYADTQVATQELAPVLLANNKVKGDGGQLGQDANALTTAFGLALRGLV